MLMKKAICTAISMLVPFLAFCGCSSDNSPAANIRDFVSMDTVFSLRTGDMASDGSNDGSIDDVFDECEALAGEIDGVLSDALPESETYSFNTQVNALLDADAMLTEVLSFAMEISNITGGAYDPAIGALTKLWNIRGGGPVPSEEQIKSALAVSGVSHIEIKDDAVYKTDPGVMLDFGGIGKGYAAQRIAEHLFTSGVTYGIVSAGRTVGVFGDKPDGSPFKIGIADPFNTDGVVGYLYTENGFVAVAGDYEQFFMEDGVKYHHIMDPSTGYPSNSGLTSVAVLSQNGAAADALSTALMVMGYDKGMELYTSVSIQFEAVFIEADGTVKLTDGLSDGKFEFSEDSVSVSSVVENAAASAEMTAPKSQEDTEK